MTLRYVDVPVGGAARRVLVVDPPGRPSAIVVCLHGSRSDPAGQARLSGMDRLAKAGQAVVAFPQGSVPLGRGWGWDPDTDLPFLSALVDRLRLEHPLVGRACVAGMSGGARMASRLAGARSDAVGTLGAVAGLRAPDRPPGRAIAVIAFHGMADRINPYRGGGREEWRESVPDAARAWAIANGISTSARESAVGRALTSTAYGGDGGPGEVVLWTIRGGGHTWPGGRTGLIGRFFLGATTREIDATAEIWRFHERHA